MKALVNHLVKTNMDEILSRSLMNCHAHGLHSVMLLNSPGKTIRLFVTTPDHTLWLNVPGHPLSIGFHAHHCELTLLALRGAVRNWIVRPDASGPLWTTRFNYTSAITDGKPSFVEDGMRIFSSDLEATETLHNGRPYFMGADQYHTVFVPQDRIAAWLVFEGREHSAYDKATYSNLDLERMSFQGLYQPADKDQILFLLSVAHLL